MKPVARDELLDYVTYGERRDELRPLALAAKRARRVVVGDPFLFLFENRDTVRYQVQEMMRTEQIVKEADIVHELQTYNELLGERGELGCTLMVGIDDVEERAVRLREWQQLNEHIYVRLDDGTKVRASWDPRQVGEERLSSVQYLKFAVGPRAPKAVGIDLPGIEIETTLDGPQRAALQSDLDAD